jgi:uncharacterized membrane protein
VNAAPRGARPTRAVVVLLFLTLVGLAIGWGTKAACTDTYRTEAGMVALDWRENRQYTAYCYSDTIPLYGVERLDAGGFPYRTGWEDGAGNVRYMEYPVVTGLLQWGVMQVTKAVVGDRVNPDPPEVVRYFQIMALVLAAAWVAAVACTIPLARRPADVALMALSPLVMVHAFTNFDTLAVALAAGGLLAWARGRPGWAGVLIGVGAAAKLYPAFLLGALLVLCWRAGTLRTWGRTAGAAVAAWLAVNLPIAVLYPHGWWEFFRLNSTRPADHDSVYHAISVLTGWAGFDGPLAAGQSPERLNAVSALLFVLACGAIAVVALTAPRRPRVASLAFLVVAAFLLTNKVWSPQYSLWLVPLAVLAFGRAWALLPWMALDAYLWMPRLGYFLNLADPARGNSPQVFVGVVLVRDALVLALCAIVVGTIYRPASDPVRRDGSDDPAGGVLDGAPDVRTLSREARRAGPRSPGSRRGRTGPTPVPAPRSTP